MYVLNFIRCTGSHTPTPLTDLMYMEIQSIYAHLRR